MQHRQQYRHLLLTLIFVCAGLASPSSVLPAAAKTASGGLPGSERFHTSAAAAAHCPSDTVVWSTFSKSRVFHLSDSKYFGKTKHGAYACEKDVMSAGYHASKR